jgi:hypothetical protein
MQNLTLKRNFDIKEQVVDLNLDPLDTESIIESKLSDDKIINDAVTESYLRSKREYSSEEDSFSEIGDFNEFCLDNYQEQREEQIN